MTPDDRTETQPGPDELLIRRACRGDSEAVEAVVTKLLPVIRRWARGLVVDGDDADDVAQAALIAVARGLAGFDGRSGIETWSYRILRRSAADHFRSKRRRSRLAEAVAGATDSEEPAGSPVNVGAVDQDRTMARVRAAFAKLPGRQREVFDMVDLQGLGAEVVAGRLGIAVATVRVHLLRARRAIRGEIMKGEPALTEGHRGLQGGA